VALCPAVDVASQGNTIEQARQTFMKHWSWSSERASETEITERLLA